MLGYAFNASPTTSRTCFLRFSGGVSHIPDTVLHPKPSRRNRLRIACAKPCASPRCLALARAAASRPPCFRGAARHRSNPSGVRGPVLLPPCIRQRPFTIAAPRQVWPVRLQVAPHRGAALAQSSSTRHRGASAVAQGSSCAPEVVTLRCPPAALL